MREEKGVAVMTRTSAPVMVKATAHRKPPVTSSGRQRGVLLELGAEQLELGRALPDVGALEAA